MLIFFEAHAETMSERIDRHRNKAGLYLRLVEPQRSEDADYYFRHPLVDAVIVTFTWAEIEPELGKYDFSGMDMILTLAKKHKKGLVFSFPTYGQSPTNRHTPAWLYDKDIRKLTFKGGGVSKGSLVSVPKVWNSNYLREYEKFVRKIGERYENESSIWYIMPGIGHIGKINAQPSKGGAQSFLKEGWTPAVWKNFCLNVVRLYQAAFRYTPLLVNSPPMLLRDKNHNMYLKEANEILIELAKIGVSVISFGLEPDNISQDRKQILNRLTPLSVFALNGDIRVGIGDDWPLWVPEHRQKSKPTLGRNEAGLARELRYAFGGVEDLPKSNISMLYVLHPEIDASHPDKGKKQNKEVYRLLEAARKRLKEEDPVAKLLNKK
jgi:hypothetical protein